MRQALQWVLVFAAKTSARHCCSFSEKDGIQRLDHKLHMKQFTGTGNNN